jgi:hypothetical protein
MKKLFDMTYEELVEHVSQEIHTALLTKGGPGIRSAVYLWLSQAIMWSEREQKVKEKCNHERH